MKYAVRLSDDEVYSLRELLEQQDDDGWLAITDLLDSDLDGEIELSRRQYRRLTDLLEHTGNEELLTALRRAEPAQQQPRRIH